MKGYLFVVLALLLVILSCEHNVYLDEKNIWRVGDKTSKVFFSTANEAINYIINNQGKAISSDRTITLMEPVLAPGSDGILDSSYNKYVRDDSLRCSIHVPSNFTGELCIDFNGLRYDYSNGIDYFFVIEGGSTVNIYNGETVIFKESQSPITNPALIVGTRTVTIDEHIIDDRRRGPNEEYPAAVHVTENGSLVITCDKDKREETGVAGTFQIDDGGTVLIEEGTVVISDLIDPVTRSQTDFCITGGHILYPHKIETQISAAIPAEYENNVKRDIIHGPLKHTEAKAPTCLEDGNIEYWQCTYEGCYKYFSDEECTDEISYEETVIKKLSHNLLHRERVESTCTEHGVKEHWVCHNCGHLFLNEQATTETTYENLILDLKDHDYETKWTTNLDYHWHECKVCHTVDPETLEEHKWNEGEIISPTGSHKDGVIRYTCTVCLTTWDKAIPAHDHVYGPEHVVEPTCTEHGYTWHQCTVEYCQQITIIPDSYTDPYYHDQKEFREGKEPTCTESGIIDHWYCNRCQQYSDNEYFTHIISPTDIYIKPLGHDYDPDVWTKETYKHYHFCKRCEAHLDEDYHNEDRICQDGESGHHWECTVCDYNMGSQEHIWDETDKYCIVCGFQKPQKPSGGGGFEVQIITKEPSGYIDYEYPDKEIIVTYHDKNTAFKANKLEWYLNNKKQTETGEVFKFIPTGPYTHTVMCIFSNDYGMGSDTKVITGK